MSYEIVQILSIIKLKVVTFQFRCRLTTTQIVSFHNYSHTLHACKQHRYQQPRPDIKIDVFHNKCNVCGFAIKFFILSTDIILTSVNKILQQSTNNITVPGKANNYFKSSIESVRNSAVAL